MQHAFNMYMSPHSKQLYNEVKEIISIVKPISTGVLSLKDDIFLQICAVQLVKDQPGNITVTTFQKSPKC